MSNQGSHSLPRTAPEISFLQHVRGPEFLPFALYTLEDGPHSALAELANELEGDATIDAGSETIHLVTVADETILQQGSLEDVLSAHIKYGRDHIEDLSYFPFGFLVAHDKDWHQNGVYLVYVDFEEPFTVTGFRLKSKDVENACPTLRDDDNGVEQLRDMYEMK